MATSKSSNPAPELVERISGSYMAAALTLDQINAIAALGRDAANHGAGPDRLGPLFAAIERLAESCDQELVPIEHMAYSRNP